MELGLSTRANHSPGVAVHREGSSFVQEELTKEFFINISSGRQFVHYHSQRDVYVLLRKHFRQPPAPVPNLRTLQKAHSIPVKQSST